MSKQELRALLYLSDNVAYLRKRAGLSQLQLAKRVGTTQSCISRLETPLAPSTTLRLLAKVADALNVSIIDLLGKPKINYTQTVTRIFIG